MDKTMSRSIGYDKTKEKAEIPAKKETTKKEQVKRVENPVDAKKAKKSAKQTSGAEIGIIEWLQTHPLIKVSALCKMIKIDPANFHRLVNVKKEIPKEILDKITPILVDYGFSI